MIRFFLVAIIVLCFSSLAYADLIDKSTKPLIYNEKALTKQLKNKGKEEVLKVLGMPAVKKLCDGCKEDLEYWWYSLKGTGIFVHFKDDKVISISVITEDKRSKEL